LSLPEVVGRRNDKPTICVRSATKRGQEKSVGKHNRATKSHKKVKKKVTMKPRTKWNKEQEPPKTEGEQLGSSFGFVRENCMRMKGGNRRVEEH